jgi:hypothetical protein
MISPRFPAILHNSKSKKDIVIRCIIQSTISYGNEKVLKSAAFRLFDCNRRYDYNHMELQIAKFISVKVTEQTDSALPAYSAEELYPCV